MAELGYDRRQAIAPTVLSWPSLDLLLPGESRHGAASPSAGHGSIRFPPQRVPPRDPLMARIRTLKPEHRQHRKVGKLSHITYRLWVGMILEADDAGRLICDPEHLRVVIFGYHPKVTNVIVASALRELESSGLVVLYTANEVPHAYFPSWHDHQRIDRAQKSTLPEPPALACPVNLAKYAEVEDSTNVRRTLDESSRILANVRGGREGIGREGSEGSGSGVAPNGASPRDAHTNGHQWHIPGSILSALERSPRLGQIARLHDTAFWQAEIRANPGVDLAREVLKAEAYLTAHPEKRYKRLSEFLHNWLGRADRPVEAQ